MYKFAHLGDCHLGAWRDHKLKELNLDVFMLAMDKCVEEQVNFIVITGDLFDTTMPDLSLVNKAVEKIRKVTEQGISVYLTYGSHDFAANAVSIIDILNSAGLFRKVVEPEPSEENKITLKFIHDRKTGAKLVGLSGRRLGLEKSYYQMLDLPVLEKEKGFKIFAFHNAITEVRSMASYPDGVPMSSFPKGFDYYAGGHVHDSSKNHIKDYGFVTFPGCLFGSTYTDLEVTGKGEKRGFFIVSFTDKVEEVRFVEVKTKEVLFLESVAEGKTAKQVYDNLTKLVNANEISDKIVLLKIAGKLAVGRPSDIDFNQIKQLMIEKDAFVANINRSALTSPEELNMSVQGESKQEIENKILAELISTYKLDQTLQTKLRQKLEKVLTKEGGVSLAKNLLVSLKLEKQEGEKTTDFENRILTNTIHLLNLEEADE
jgi:exonuclease SbcD